MMKQLKARDLLLFKVTAALWLKLQVEWFKVYYSRFCRKNNGVI